jgi:hypothetical protein
MQVALLARWADWQVRRAVHDEVRVPKLGGVKGWQRVDIDEPIIRRKVYRRDKSGGVKGFTRTGDAFRATEPGGHVVQTNVSPERVKKWHLFLTHTDRTLMDAFIASTGRTAPG